MPYELPQNILRIIENELSKLSIENSRLGRSSSTQLYGVSNEESKSQLRSLSPEEQRSYLATRMPATFAACSRIIEILQNEIVDFKPRTILDLGAGPGTATLAAVLKFPTIESTELVERERYFLSSAEKFIKAFSEEIKFDANISDISKDYKSGNAELVIASYSLNEIPESSFENFIHSTWKATETLLVIVEPGTINGFSNIIKARAQLLQLGGYVVAPCPHALPCPLTGNNWCHFRVRFNRSKIHKSVKDASLNYEEEPFSFVVFSKKQLPLPSGDRIIGFPRKEKGFATFDVCSRTGKREKLKLLKRNKEAYSAARKLTWGDKL